MAFITKNRIHAFINRFRGWKTNRRIIVFESDDWGMIRTSSVEAFDDLCKKGYPLDKNIYAINDAFERTLDIERLIETLNSTRFENGSTPKFTLNNVLFNPDFDKIKRDEFKVYHRQHFLETAKEYTATDNLLQVYQQGIEAGFLQPQFHCTEHVNVNNWMQALISEDATVHAAFQHKMVSINDAIRVNDCRAAYLDTFNISDNQDFDPIDLNIKIGLTAFEETWGFKATSFIASCYIWPKKVEAIFKQYGVEYIQGNIAQRLSQDEQGKYALAFHYLGQKNSFGQRYLIRNCVFEPASNPGKDWVNSCLSEIHQAFSLRKPAIICSHRVNYIGRLRNENADKNLQQLGKLLFEIRKRWPDVEFMSSDELGKCMEKK